MKRRVLACELLVVLVVSMVVGCGKKTVDYSIDGDTEESTQQQERERVELTLAEFKTVGTWEDEWTIGDAEGHEWPVEINADVVEPDIDNISVIEVEELDMGEQFRKQFVRTYFENGDIYNHDESQYTKAELEEIIANIERNMEEVDAETQEEWQQRLEDYEEQLETAPEEPVVAEDYAACTEYVGTVGSGAGTVRFDVEDRLVWADVNYANVMPASLSGFETMTLDYDYVSNDEIVNECKYSEEEALGVAERFLAQVGMSNQVCLESKELMWRGENWNGDSLESYDFALYGYSFTFGTGVDNLAFSQFPDFEDFDLAGRSNLEYGAYNNGDSVTLIVMDDGVIRADVNDPVVVRAVEPVSELLPVEEIQAVLKEEVLENPQKYDLTRMDVYNNRKFNRMELIYLKTKDETQEGIYHYVPTWCFGDYWEDGEYSYWFHPVFVNAIDGSVLNLFDTSVWWEEYE